MEKHELYPEDTVRGMVIKYKLNEKEIDLGNERFKKIRTD